MSTCDAEEPVAAAATQQAQVTVLRVRRNHKRHCDQNEVKMEVSVVSTKSTTEADKQPPTKKQKRHPNERNEITEPSLTNIGEERAGHTEQQTISVQQVFQTEQPTGVAAGRWCSLCHQVQISKANYYCKLCRTAYQTEREKTLDGYLQKMSQNCTHSALKRKGEAAVCTLTKDDWLRKWTEQKGLCFNTGIPMAHAPASDWQASPERLNNRFGYIDSNCVLIVSELNTGNTQWSLAKIEFLIQELRRFLDPAVQEALQARVQSLVSNALQELANKTVVYRETIDGVRYLGCNGCQTIVFADDVKKGNLCDSCRNAENARHCLERKRAKTATESEAHLFSHIRRNITRELINGVKHFHCKGCGTLTAETGLIEYATRCGPCAQQLRHRQHESLLVCMSKLLSNAKTNCKHKSAGRNISCDLTEHELIDMFKNQQGRCDHSSMPMVVGKGKDLAWAVSLERVNVNENYTKTNCVLICREFNGSDRSAVVKYSNGGGAGWNRLKFQHFLQSVTTKFTARQPQQAVNSSSILTTGASSSAVL